jgi:hypothetical protein
MIRIEPRFGIMWRRRIVNDGTPMKRAAAMYSRSRSDSAIERSTRA